MLCPCSDFLFDDCTIKLTLILFEAASVALTIMIIHNICVFQDLLYLSLLGITYYSLEELVVFKIEYCSNERFVLNVIFFDLLVQSWYSG